MKNRIAWQFGGRKWGSRSAGARSRPVSKSRRERHGSTEPVRFLGREIRGLRRARGYTLAELAKATHLSVGYLSLLERDLATPSINALQAISRAFGVTISWFFEAGAAPEAERDIVVRRARRRRLDFTAGIVDELLSPSIDSSLELLSCRFAPGASSGENPYTHAGEEAGVVIRGAPRDLGRRQPVSARGRGQLRLREHPTAPLPQSRSRRDGSSVGDNPTDLLRRSRCNAVTPIFGRERPSRRPTRRRPTAISRPTCWSSGRDISGCSAALHLAERGVDVIAVDRHGPGSGASGRNGGQVIPGLKYDPDEIEALFGRENGERLWRFAGATADVVFDLIERHGLNAQSRRTVWVQPVDTHAAASRAQRRTEQWAKRGAAVEFWGRDQVAAVSGAARYLGAFVDRRAGSVQPLSYARELARAGLRAKARIYGDTEISSLTRSEKGWLASARRRTTIRADTVLVCTNAYSDDHLIKGLGRSIVAANSLQIATEPLPARASAPHPGRRRNRIRHQTYHSLLARERRRATYHGRARPISRARTRERLGAFAARRGRAIPLSGPGVLHTSMGRSRCHPPQLPAALAQPVTRSSSGNRMSGSRHWLANVDGP